MPLGADNTLEMITVYDVQQCNVPNFLVGVQH